MIKKRTVKYIACDICGAEIEDANILAPLIFTCCKCGKQVCEEHCRVYKCESDGSILTLCTECLEDLNPHKRKTLSDFEDISEVE